MDFLRWIAIWICVPIYKTIPKMYSIFYFLSNARFLSEGVIDELSKNLYVLVSVVMLFAFSATLLSAIVNPDLFADKKKGFWAVFKRSVIGIVLIVGIPFLFDLAYEFQGAIMQNNTIEKIVLGINYSDDSNTIGGKGGQVIAGKLISSVVYPYADEVEVEVDGLAEAYEKMITTDIEYISTVAKHIDAAPAGDSTDEDYALKFDGLIAIIAGGVTVYILLIFAIDMAVRMFKLAFLELTAPISIMAYIAVGDEVFGKWRKEVIKTYVDVFIRVGAMGFYLFLISHLTTFFNSSVLWGAGVDKGDTWLSQTGWTLLLQVIIIVGMLIFVKQIPEFINRTFGTNLKLKGGIGGRLGEMAAVGDIAKKAWKSLPKVGAYAAGRVASGTKQLASGADDKFFGGKGKEISENFKEFMNKDRVPFANSNNRALQKIGSGADSFIKGTARLANNGGVTRDAIKAAAGASSIFGVNKAVTDALEKNEKYMETKKADYKKVKNNMYRASDIDPTTGLALGNTSASVIAGKTKASTYIGDNLKKKNQIDAVDKAMNASLKAAALEGYSSEFDSSVNALDSAKKIGRAKDVAEDLGLIAQRLSRTGNVQAAINDVNALNLDSDIKDGILSQLATTQSLKDGIIRDFAGVNLNGDSAIKLEAQTATRAKTATEGGLKAEIDKSSTTADEKKAMENYQKLFADQSDNYVRIAKEENAGRYFTPNNNANAQNNPQPVQGNNPQPQTGAGGTQNAQQQTTTQTPNVYAQSSSNNQTNPYGMDQSNYQQIIDSGVKPNTPEFHSMAYSMDPNYNGMGAGASAFGVSQEAFDEAIAQGIQPFTQEFHQHFSGIAGYNGMGGEQPSQNSGNINNNPSNSTMNSQNVTINATNADVSANSANVNANNANINSQSFNFDGNSNSSRFDFEDVSSSSDSNIVDAINSQTEDLASSIEKATNSINQNANINAKKDQEQNKKINENLDRLNDNKNNE